MMGLVATMTSHGITKRFAPEGPSRASARNRKILPINRQKPGKIEYVQVEK